MNEDVRENLIKALKTASEKAGITDPEVGLTHPEDISHGDFTTNLALVYAKHIKMSPKALAEKIVEGLKKVMPEEVEKVEIAGPGFINITLKDSYFAKEILAVAEQGNNFGKIKLDAGKKIMVEYTDPNPFKIFHIGHLMANAIGESLSRIIEYSGAEVIRASWQGDVGLHVAKTLWAELKNMDIFPKESIPLVERIQYLGQMYALGAEKYDSDEVAKKEIVDINKKIFEKSDAKVNKVYDLGRAWSLDYFETIYKKLGTKFDNYFFEGIEGKDGSAIVQKFLEKGIFEKSEGAIIFPGEKYGVHTRVFINSQGLPTYEAKELGLTAKKFSLYPDLSLSIVVTANEQSDYFKVLIEALKICMPEAGNKTKHISHGLLRPSSGKMSSRKGNVVSAEELIEEFESLVADKIQERGFDTKTEEEIKSEVAISAIKFIVLRQSIGGDIIYDPKKAVSFEGDSGPYLQYACVRSASVLAKAHDAGISGNMSEISKNLPEKVEKLEKLMLRFPEVITRARLEYAPHYIVTYLIELSSAFNSYYAVHKIIDEKDPLSSYRVLLTKVFSQIMTNGLYVLGIKVPKKM